ncbi:hypothetical protein BJ944DRAFT_262099 [Cunninghamella echinulata]|nr:hypothetical protein BJ944DRAFT_262099 [Cunninghamella echinulata]
MTLSYLSNGQSITGVNVESFKLTCSTSLSTADSYNSAYTYSEEESPLYIDTLNLRHRGLTQPQDIVPHLLSFSSTISQLLVELDLSRNELSDLPSELEQLKQLKQLNLSCNQFTTIPNVLFRLATLTHLNLTENRLTSLHQLPTYLTNLQSLRISSNQLEQLDDNIVLWKKMKILQLGSEGGGNKLKELPGSLLEMEELEELDVSNNQLEEFSSSLPASLKYLKLSGNQLKEVPDDILIQCPHLLTLDVSFNRLAFLPFFYYPVSSSTSSPSSTHTATATLDISHNNISIIPTSVLNLFIQVILFGNPALEYNRKSTTIYAQKLRELSKFAVYSTTENDLFMDFTLINLLNRHKSPSSSIAANFSNMLLNEEENQEEQRDHINGSDNLISPSSELMDHPFSRQSNQDFLFEKEERLPENNKNKERFITENGESWVPSLRELTMRYIQKEKINKWQEQDMINNIPCMIVDDLKVSNSCDICGMPCIKEWLSAIQVKSYKNYTSVVCKIALCSTTCWLIHYQNTRAPSFSFPAENNHLHPHHLHDQALETTLYGLLNNNNNILQPQLPQLDPIDPDSFEWIVAAATASALQISQDNALV